VHVATTLRQSSTGTATDAAEACDDHADDHADQTAKAEADATQAAETAAAEATKLSEAAEKEANGLITQVNAYIKDNKLDLADKALADLEALKESLPEEFADKIAALGTALDGAKKAGEAAEVLGDIKLPGQSK
jgi:hypothetical protein